MQAKYLDLCSIIYGKNILTGTFFHERQTLTREVFFNVLFITEIIHEELLTRSDVWTF